MLDELIKLANDPSFTGASVHIELETEYTQDRVLYYKPRIGIVGNFDKATADMIRHYLAAAIRMSCVDALDRFIVRPEPDREVQTDV